MAGHDMFYEPPAARSPAALRHPPQSDLLHRQASRHFEAYGQLPAAGTASASAFYPFDEQSVAAARLDPHLPPPRYAGRISPGAGTAAAWNAASFGQNNALAPLSAAARLKPVSSANSILSAAPGRARSALATVSRPSSFSSLPLTTLSS